jgi:hypothetical protein
MDHNIYSGIKRLAAMSTIMAGMCTLEAGSAIWNLNPVTNEWNDKQNWTPATMPYGENELLP